MSACKIVPASRENVAAIHGMVAELAEYEKLTHVMVSTVADFERELFGPDARVEGLIVECDGKPVAFALFFHNFSSFVGRKGLYLEDVFVKPAYRGKGIGKDILKHLARLAVERNCGRFEWSVLDWNQSAIDFYEKLGATVMPDWRIVRATGDALKKLASF